MSNQREGNAPRVAGFQAPASDSGPGPLICGWGGGMSGVGEGRGGQLVFDSTSDLRGGGVSWRAARGCESGGGGEDEMQRQAYEDATSNLHRRRPD